MAAGRGALAAGAEGAGRARSEDAGIPLAAGGIAGVAVRAGTENADAGVGQAAAEGVGGDAALAPSLRPCPFLFAMLRDAKRFFWV